jgi:hypothetical protein
MKILAGVGIAVLLVIACLIGYQVSVQQAKDKAEKERLAEVCELEAWRMDHVDSSVPHQQYLDNCLRDGPIK